MPHADAGRKIAGGTPGVYLFQQATTLVYVGRAGERGGNGLCGRLTIYVSGRAPARRSRDLCGGAAGRPWDESSSTQARPGYL